MALGDSIRRNLKQPTAAENQEQTRVNKANQLYTYFSNARRKTEYEWWLNDQFYQGEQYVAYNRSVGAVQRISPKNDNQIVINKIKQNARFVVMWLNQDHPNSDVLPGSPDDGAYDRAKKAEHYLDYLYEKLRLNVKNKQTTLDAYKYKMGFQKILWNKDALAPTAPYIADGLSTTASKGEVMIERVDPFELYWDPQMYSDVESSRGFIHAIPRTLGEVRNNPLYMNTDKVQSDAKLASSFIKESMIRAQTQGAAQFEPGGQDDMSTVIVREAMWREFSKDHGKFIIRLVVTTTSGVLLRDEIWPMDFYPYEMYLADVQGSPLDGGSPIRDLRSPQRALNQFNSLVQENGRVMAKINWSVPRGSNVNVITDEVGQFLEYDASPGGRPEQITPSGLPAYVGQHLDRLEKYIDDIGGNHSASYGRSPGSKASGELVNKLQEGDSNNLRLMRDNLDDFQSRVNKKALLTFKFSASVDRNIRTSTTNAVGKYGMVNLKPSEVSIDDDVKVVTGNRMPYSNSDKQEMLLNMKKEGIIDNKTFLRAANMSDLDNAMNTSQLDIERALGENRDLLAGKPIGAPVKGEDHAVHMEVHVQLIKSPEFKAATPVIQDAILDHYDQHINQNYQLAMISASMNVDPIKRSEAIMYRPNNFAEMTPTERTQIFGKFGVQSDAQAIQMRGGLNVQEPAAAEQQAQLEDTEMLDGTPVMISMGDNHKVHIETHSQVMQTPAWDVLPDVLKRNFDRHINQHMTALEALAPTAGLVQTEGSDIPNKPQIVQPPVKTNQAAMNPENPTPRPLMPHEAIQHKGAVINQRATEAMQVQQAQEQAAQAAKAAPTTKPSTKKKTVKA